jgi:Carboxypeptidase regulatory-like domain
MSRAFDPRAFRGKANRVFPVGALAVVSLLVVGLDPALAVSPIVPSGGLKGVVADISGQPRMGAVVLLFNRQDKLMRRAVTNGEGGFAFGDLLPDAYSIRVTLSSFIPAVKSNIMVQAGKLRLLDISLSTLFSSIQLLPITNGDARSLMSDDWKWVLRTSSSSRPVLRFLPVGNSDPSQESHRAVFSGTRGLVKVSTGDSMDGNIDAGDLGTAFALATSLYGTNHLKISGNLGYGPESGMPSAGFRTSYSRDIGGMDPEISVTMRQLSIPNRVGAAIVAGGGLMGGTSDSSLPPLRMISISSSDRNKLSDSLEIVYGFDLDVVSFIQRLHYLSPYARITWTGFGGKVDVTYTSGNARPGLDSDDRGTDPDLSRDLEALSVIPRVGLRDDQAKVQRGDDYEIAYSKKVGSREYRVSGFRERVSNTALRLSNAGGEFSGDLLPDLYSASSIFDAGTFNSMGYTASVTQHLGEHVKVTAIYGASDTLTPQSNALTSDTADDLRKLLRSTRRGEVTLRASAVVPVTGTRVSGSYQFTDYNTFNPAQIYSTQTARPVPGLNLTIRQPIPASFGLPWRMEATADVRNVRAQGYLPITAADGRQFLVVQNPRTFRGGLSFIF